MSRVQSPEPTKGKYFEKKKIKEGILHMPPLTLIGSITVCNDPTFYSIWCGSKLWIFTCPPRFCFSIGLMHSRKCLNSIKFKYSIYRHLPSRFWAMWDTITLLGPNVFASTFPARD